MDWKSAVEEEKAALKRIVALLFALADLAESTCGRSRLVRKFVLWILRSAEALAWDFVIGAEEPPAFLRMISDGDGPDNALCLAQRFRHLAWELENQARFAFVVHDESEQAGMTWFGAGRTLDTNHFLIALQQVFAQIAGQAAYATGPPDTSERASLEAAAHEIVAKFGAAVKLDLYCPNWH